MLIVTFKHKDTIFFEGTHYYAFLNGLVTHSLLLSSQSLEPTVCQQLSCIYRIVTMHNLKLKLMHCNDELNCKVMHHNDAINCINVRTHETTITT